MKEKPLFMDMHTHTFRSIDSQMPISTLISTATERGSYVAVTDHDTIEALPEAHEFAESKNTFILPGLEVTCRAERNIFRSPHLLVLGVDHTLPDTKKIPTGKDPRFVMEWAHDIGAIAIAAHPKKNGGLFSFNYDELQEYAEKGLLDGVERISRWRNDSELSDIAMRLHLLQTAGSDAHRTANIGQIGVQLSEPCSHWEDVINQIKLGVATPIVRSAVPYEPIGKLRELATKIVHLAI